jgi:uncharacterized membrane protein YphA (DoxX/SURF4 family)
MLASFILRIVLGFILLNLGYMKFKIERKRWEIAFEAFRLKPASTFVTVFAYIEILGALMLILGFLTQIAALVFVIITVLELYVERKEDVLLKRDLAFYLLIFAIALSLLLTGAGSFAFDLPL